MNTLKADIASRVASAIQAIDQVDIQMDAGTIAIAQYKFVVQAAHADLVLCKENEAFVEIRIHILRLHLDRLDAELKRKNSKYLIVNV